MTCVTIFLGLVPSANAKTRIQSVCGALPLALLLGAVLLVAGAPAFGEKVPIDRVLNPDGTLNTSSGFSGSIDVAGYQMVADAGGAPRFVAENAQGQRTGCDLPWSSLGAGTDGAVRALALVGTDLYAGGEFTTAGGVRRRQEITFTFQV